MKKLLIPLLFLLVSCTCLPQIPPQYLPANNSCEAYLPNYLQFISVLDFCDNAILTQEPLPGTILDAANPYYKVKITATNTAGSDIEQFDVFLMDVIPEIIWDSIPGDTIPIAQYRNDIDLLIDAHEKYRAHLGDTNNTDTLTWKTLTIHYPPGH